MKSVFTLRNLLTLSRSCKMFVLAAAFSLTVGAIRAQTVYALSNNNLITFNPAIPAAVTTVGTLTGIADGQTVEGMDFRPATGQLFALGYNKTSGVAQLYTINLKTAAAAAISAGATLPSNLSNFGFDFNPTVDRIRVVSGNLNYRMNPLTGGLAATDSTLRYIAGDVRAGITPGAVAAAYTNSYVGTGTTTMYVYDYADNSLASSSNPNIGLLSTLGNTTNNSGITPASATGIDLDVAYNASTGTNTAYLIATVGGGSGLYTVNLTSGAATSVGAIGANNVTEMAVYFPPTPVSKVVYALANGNTLISFNSATPGTVRTIGTIPLANTQAFVGLDFRPATGQLYAMSYEAISGKEQLYTIDTTNATATAIGVQQQLALNMTRIGFDFNPVPDRIRVTGSGGQNYRLNPDNGAIASNTDGNLNYVAGDVNAGKAPGVVTVAYNNSIANFGSTTMYAYDSSYNTLDSSNNPNAGQLTTINALNIALTNADSIDMDISFNSANGSNFALLAAASTLYNLNLATGAIGSLGTIGSGISVSDIAIYIAPPPPVRTVFALSANNLVSFTSSTPGTVNTIGNISGVTDGQTLVGLDFRPANNMLYAFGYNSTNGEGRIYSINTTTAQATPVGTAAITMLPAGMMNIGFDFNPTVDRIRLTSSNGQNYRLNPDNGAIGVVDGTLNYSTTTGDVNSGVVPTVAAVGYTNSFAANLNGTTTLYYYDYGLDVLATTTDPNNGILRTVGNSGIRTSVNANQVDMDIVYSAGVNTAFLSAPISGSTNNLYTINTRTGELKLVGTIGISITKMAFSNFDPLPVTLVDFSGKKVGSSSELSWATQSESNTSHFIIERSSDGIHFTAVSGKISSQAANGNSTQRLNYSYADVTPAIGINFYRLVQVDKDGKTTTSKTVQLRFNGGYNISLYPNPATSFININGNIADQADLQIRLSDLNGKTIGTTVLKGQQGNWNTQLPVSRLASGTYYITVIKDNTIIYTEAVQKK